MSKLGAAVAELESGKGESKAGKPAQKPGKARTKAKNPKVAGRGKNAVIATVERQEAVRAAIPKKHKVPRSIEVNPTGTTNYTDTRKGSEITAKRFNLTFKATGNAYSVSSVLRWLGFWCGATQASAMNWLAYCGFDTTAACAGQQTSSGKHTPFDEKTGKPTGPGRHGSVPALKAEEAKELKALWSAANPDNE